MLPQLLFIASTIGVGFSANADSYIFTEISYFQLDKVIQDDYIYERLQCDVDVMISYEDMDVVIEDLYVFSDTLELIVQVPRIQGGTFITKRNLVVQVYDCSINNGFFTGYLQVDFSIFYSSIQGNQVAYYTHESRLSRDLEAQSDSVSFNTFPLIIDLTDGENEAYNEGYNDGYDEGYTDGYDEGYTDGDEHGYMVGFENGEEYGYEQGYKEGYNNQPLIDNVIKMIKGVFSGLDTLLNIEIIPGKLKLSIILIVPIAFGIIQFFLNLWR